MKLTTTTTGAALLIAATGLIAFPQITRAGGHGSGGGRSFGRNLGSMNRGPDSFVGMHGSINRGHGADDLANHNANDDRGRNRGAGELNRMNRRGADDPANHDASDDRGRHHMRGSKTMNRGGVDDPANHDANDDRGRHHRRHGETANGQTLNNRGRDGADDPANHDARDDRGNDGVGHR